MSWTPLTSPELYSGTFTSVAIQVEPGFYPSSGVTAAWALCGELYPHEGLSLPPACKMHVHTKFMNENAGR